MIKKITYEQFMAITIIIAGLFGLFMSKNSPSLSDKNYKGYMILWAILIIIGFLIETYFAIKILEREDKK